MVILDYVTFWIVIALYIYLFVIEKFMNKFDVYIFTKMKRKKTNDRIKTHKLFVE